MNNRKEYMKKYYQEHKEYYRIALQKYRDKNRERYNETDRKYRKRKREEAKENAELVIKQKEVLDKIKELIKVFNENVSYLRWNEDDYVDYIKEIEKALEEIE